ncbi:MAG: hypothetical protein ABIH48_01730 [Candidatus Falkowbacteria bacterium]
MSDIEQNTEDFEKLVKDDKFSNQDIKTQFFTIIVQHDFNFFLIGRLLLILKKYREPLFKEIIGIVGCIKEEIDKT